MLVWWPEFGQAGTGFLTAAGRERPGKAMRTPHPRAESAGLGWGVSPLQPHYSCPPEGDSREEQQ